MFLLFLSLVLGATTPVDLQTCRIATAMPVLPDKPAPAQPLVGGVAVTFVNRASQTATDVTFRVAYDYRTALLTDHGKFSPGARISTTFDQFNGANYFRDEPDSCAIERVRFADGSVWSATLDGSSTLR